MSKDKEETVAENPQLLIALKLLYGDVTFLPITDDVIAKFVEQGAESDLRAMKADGGIYCLERNSIVFPPEIDLP